MIFHGNAESVSSVETQQVAMFQHLGYSVMTWDYPGYGKSTNCWFNQDDLLHDSETAYEWLAKQTPESQIVLYGRSVGTGLAVYIASKHPVRQVLLVSPYDALLNVSIDHMPFFVPVSIISHLPLKASYWLDQVKCSVHAIHGLNDTLINPERAVALFRKAKSNMKIIWVAGAKHNDIILFEEYKHWLTSALLN
jgi:pimeloyl-ACP methyl ester carboxylesterase